MMSISKAAAGWPATGCGELQLCHFGLCTGPGRVLCPCGLVLFDVGFTQADHLLSYKTGNLLFYNQSFTLAKTNKALSIQLLRQP